MQLFKLNMVEYQNTHKNEHNLRRDFTKEESTWKEAAV
jgi:hypothetical protein